MVVLQYEDRSVRTNFNNNVITDLNPFEVSESTKSCLSLSLSEEEQEEGEPDLHQCGHCKLMFNNLKKYISHKLQKVCWNDEENSMGDRGTPDNEVTSEWPPDQNGVSSPDVLSKEDFMTDEKPAQLPPSTCVLSQNESLKRKHRKGAVRRIKPTTDETDLVNKVTTTTTEESEHDEEEVMADDKTTVFVVTEDADTEIAEELKESEKEPRDKLVIDEDIDIQNNNDIKSSNLGRYTQSIYHNTKKLKEVLSNDNIPNTSSDSIKKPFEVNSNFDYSSSTTLPSYTIPSSTRLRETTEQTTFTPDYYSKQKYDRIPSHLPQVMSTHGSPSRKYDKNHERTLNRAGGVVDNTLKNTPFLGATSADYKKYNSYTKESSVYPSLHQKFATDYSRPKYYSYQETETSSTWTSQYNQPYTQQPSAHNKSKYEGYKPYDKYRTMASMVSTSIENNVPSMINERVVEKGGELLDLSSVADTSNEPPHLVRITPAVSSPNSDQKSPPTLEKRPDSNLPTFVKQEDNEESNDSLAQAQAQGILILKSNEIEDSVDGAGKFQIVDPSSPVEKGSISPDSNQSHETEDYNQDTAIQSHGSATLAQLPRVRQLSESTVERLITEPSPQATDASWKHAKQVYRCPLCAKIFPFKSKLQRHVLVHTGIKPYKCTVCGRGFTQQIDLQRHLTRHTGEKPFKCHLCKAQFIRADNLRKHCKDAHYVSIEEPIRKRRRKATGSDTVLPPLEVAIALALSETERNGGRILGRSVTRSTTKATTVKPRSSAQYYSKPQQPEEKNIPVYPPRGQRHEVPPYASNFPSHPMPHPGQRHDVRYPFHGVREGAHPYSPDGMKKPSSGYSSSSPPYKRREMYRSPHERPYYSPQGPPPPGYFAEQRGYKSRDSPSMYYAEREQQRLSRQIDPRQSHDHRSMVPIESRSIPYLSNEAEYRMKADYVSREEAEEYISRHPSEMRYEQRPTRYEGEQVVAVARDVDENAGYMRSPRDVPTVEILGKDDERNYRSSVFARRQYPTDESEKQYLSMVDKDKSDMASYGDYRVSVVEESSDPGGSSGVKSADRPYEYSSSSSMAPPLFKARKSPLDPNAFERISPRRETQISPKFSREVEVTLDMPTDGSNNTDRISPRVKSPYSNYAKEGDEYVESKISAGVKEAYVVDANAYHVDEQEIPIVTPSDATMDSST